MRTYGSTGTGLILAPTMHRVAESAEGALLGIAFDDDQTDDAKGTGEDERHIFHPNGC